MKRHAVTMGVLKIIGWLMALLLLFFRERILPLERVAWLDHMMTVVTICAVAAAVRGIYQAIGQIVIALEKSEELK